VSGAHGEEDGHDAADLLSCGYLVPEEGAAADAQVEEVQRVAVAERGPRLGADAGGLHFGAGLEVLPALAREEEALGGVDAGAEDGADEALVLDDVHLAEVAEVVAAQQQLAGFVHAAHVERAAHEEVHVLARQAVEARVEALGHLHAVQHADVRRQRPVEHLRQLLDLRCVTLAYASASAPAD
jgi:hypothetical protein